MQEEKEKQHTLIYGLMNDTSIHIAGITILHEIVQMQDSTDTANVIVIKDEHNNEVRVHTCFGKITDAWIKNA